MGDRGENADNGWALSANSSAASEDGVAAVAQLVECVLGKDEVTGSIPVSSFAVCRAGRSRRRAGALGVADRTDVPAESE
jgi:hypothetical protein